MKTLASLALSGLALLASSGCGSTPPARFYQLQTGEPAPSAGRVRATSLAVRHVEWPKYLSGREIVTRVGPNGVRLADFDRWAEPLRDNFVRVLVGNLAGELPECDIRRFPWEAPRSFEENVTLLGLVLSLEVRRFDADEDQARLELVWQLEDGSGKRFVRRRARYESALGPTEDLPFGGIVAAMSACLSQFSTEVAAEVRKARP